MEHDGTGNPSHGETPPGAPVAPARNVGGRPKTARCTRGHSLARIGGGFYRVTDDVSGVSCAACGAPPASGARDRIPDPSTLPRTALSNAHPGAGAEGDGKPTPKPKETPEETAARYKIISERIEHGLPIAMPIADVVLDSTVGAYLRGNGVDWERIGVPSIVLVDGKPSSGKVSLRETMAVSVGSIAAAKVGVIHPLLLPTINLVTATAMVAMLVFHVRAQQAQGGPRPDPIQQGVPPNVTEPTKGARNDVPPGA